MREVLVTGVLNRNSSTRDEHLRRNYGKYSQYTENLVPAIGEVYDIDFQRPLVDITNGQSLYDYTHLSKGSYGNFINGRYFNQDREKETIGFDNLTPDQIQSWGGKYVDYITYLDEVLGEDVYSRHIRYLNDFLSGQYMENALRQTEVGVVRDFDIAIAKQGIITTNKNNFKGLDLKQFNGVQLPSGSAIDTPLGIITNYMYSNSLYNAAIFNSDRKSEQKYLTPSLISQYGNNMVNVMRLSDLLRVGVNDYRLVEDLGRDIHIIDDFKDKVGDLNVKYLTELIDNASKYNSKEHDGFNGYKLGEEGYVNYIEGENKLLDLTEFYKPSNFKSEYNQGYNSTYDTYNENDQKNNSYENDVLNKEEDSAWESYKPINGDENDKSILSKTAKLYREHKINTLMGRFHTSVDGGIPTEQEFIDTAKSMYGNSHGRNLLTKKAQDSDVADADDINGYDNPYCRTWTYHHQYNQIKKLIRPFLRLNDDGFEEPVDIEFLQTQSAKYRTKRHKQNGKNELIGPKHFADNTVLNKNGFVNITPTGDEKDVTLPIHKCMFSIENLAWKDVPKFTKDNYISKEQTGPNGGRIMWFPPYDLNFSENVNVSWNENSFIGRGEKVYTYTNTDRSGTLSFTLLIDHPSIVNSFAKLEDGDISSDIETDILRYFAGCDVPYIPVPKEPEPEDNKDKGEDKIEIEGSFSFYIFFPNDFSGCVSKTINVKKDDDIINYYDNWWKYLLIGNTCGIPEAEVGYRGYEVMPNKGITQKPSSNEDRGRWIGVSTKNWRFAGGNEYIGNNINLYEDDVRYVKRNEGDWGEYCFKYRVDNDLRQKLPGTSTNSDYRDTDSHQLNTKLNKEKYHKDADCTFGEFISYILSTKKGDESIVKHLKDNGCNEENIKKLETIFKADGFKIKRISVKGSADRHCDRQSDMLAARRAHSFKRFFMEESGLKTKTDEYTEFTCNGKKANEWPKESVSAIQNKLNRSVYVTITYTLLSQTSKWSSIQSKGMDDTTYEEESEKELKFKEWYDELFNKKFTKYGINIINEYENSDISESYSEKTSYKIYSVRVFDKKENKEVDVEHNVFYDRVKEWCENNNISYDKDDKEYKVDTKIDEIRDKFTIENGSLYLIPPLYMMDKQSDTDQYPGKSFLSNLKEHLPLFTEEKIDGELNELKTEGKDVGKKVQKHTEERDKLGKEINKIKKDLEELSTKLGEIQEKINNYTKEIEKTNKEISDTEYKLNHWTTQMGDKVKEETKLTNLKTKLFDLNNKKSIQERTLENKWDKFVDLSNEFEEKQKKYNEVNTLVESEQNEFNKIGDEIKEKNREKENKTSLGVDRVRSEVFYQKMYEILKYNNEQDLVKKYFPESKPGESSSEITEDYHFKIYSFSSDKSYYYLFETPIYSMRVDYQLYIRDDYSISLKSYPKEVNNYYEHGSHTLSYNKLLKDYLLIQFLDQNIDNGFKFACDYIFENGLYQETGKKITKDGINNLLFYQYLLSGEKVDTYDSGQTWTISTTGTSANISYYDAWECIITNKDEVVYEPFKNAVVEVNSAITEYQNVVKTEGLTEKDKEKAFKKMIGIIKDNTDSVLKYCKTNLSESIEEIKKYAKEKYDQEKKAFEDAAKERQSQILQKKYKSECETLNKIKDDVKKKRDQYLYSVFIGSGKTRYETEAEYFQKLDIEHPLIFKSIKEKYKYFNPAFHSMSPEGFNARLTFLHQCTRQGHTYEGVGLGDTTTAHNLAFGRMPVCVLRIGDFIYTRIIINNVNISYDNNGGIQWDLNPEGGGVQPMFAKVNLGITIIGGQSLNGPISRLQNAVSFNYYANTGVYDDRSDRYVLKENGDIKSFDNVFKIQSKHNDPADYSLFRSNVNGNNNEAYKDDIDGIKRNKAEFENAKIKYNDYQLDENNDQCKKEKNV